MRFGPIAFATFTLAGCGGDYSHPLPTTPTPAPTAPAPVVFTSLAGQVTDEVGICIEGATVKVIAGQRAGQELTQQMPCDYWENLGGFRFTDLAPDGQMTLRASARGYHSQEKTVNPNSARGKVGFELTIVQ
jgi:hypothetical protein